MNIKGILIISHQ